MSDEYDKARRLGQRCYQKYLLEGKYPYLQVLEEILSHAEVVSEQKLGIIQIPAELIVGTYSAGRRTAFAPNFMPLLSSGSEFASKWSTLCKAHIDEGIRDPIKAIEFMNRYYVIEGNKRVSVLKFFDAVTIQGSVTRMIPKRTDEPENRLYFEYLDFNRKTGVNYLIFSEPGSYAELEKMMGKSGSTEYSEEELQNLRSAYVRFAKAYSEKCGDSPKVQPADAMLVYLQMYSYQELCEAMPSKLRGDIDKIWEDIQLLAVPQPTEIVTEPAEAPKKNFIERLLTPGSSRKLKITFIHEKTKDSSAWTYSHELGRLQLDDVFGDQVETVCMDNIQPGESLEKALEAAVALKSDVIFTTTPQFLEGSLKAAVRHPEVKILNCSVNPAHRYVRTYYARLFEAKFLAGMIAGAVSRDGAIGYIADYPISGMIANINAFAAGAKMVNPRAKVYLEWTSVTPVEEILTHFKKWGVHIVSTQEMVKLDADHRLFGLINLDEIDAISSTKALNAIKSLITITEISERAAYRYNKEKRYRLASFCASGNKPEFLTDITGNRRWLPFLVERIVNPWHITPPYQQIYSQALYLIEHDFVYWFDHDDNERIDAHNDAFRAQTNEEQLIPVFLSIPSAGDPEAEFLTASEISALLDMDAEGETELVLSAPDGNGILTPLFRAYGTVVRAGYERDTKGITSLSSQTLKQYPALLDETGRELSEWMTFVTPEMAEEVLRMLEIISEAGAASFREDLDRAGFFDGIYERIGR